MCRSRVAGCMDLTVMSHISVPYSKRVERKFRCIRLSCMMIDDRFGGAVVGCRTRDQKVASSSSTPGRGAIKSARSTQPSILPR